MKIPAINLAPVSYNAIFKDVSYPISISNESVLSACENGVVEPRPFQTDIDELISEWDSLEQKESLLAQQNYHINRIATIINNGHWEDPIILYSDKETLLDGGHRLLANRIMGNAEIEAIVINQREAFDDDIKEQIWRAIDRSNGNAYEALKYLVIEILNY